MAELKEKNINDKVDIDEIYEDEEEIITLFNEDTKKEEDFRVIEVIEHDGKDYVLLNPVVPDDDIAEDEVIICQIEEDDDGNGCIYPVESEDVMNAVYEKYVSLYEEYMDDDEEDYEDDEETDDDEEDED